MKKKIFFFSCLILFSCLFSFLSFKVTYLIAEKYFFDKIFYQKSIAYGYWVEDKDLRPEAFGKRAQDIEELQQRAHLTPENSPQILGTCDDHKYVVTVIGDSYVWGQGIKNEERFVEILEKELNKIRPTRVVSLGNSGDNIFDNYIKYLWAKKQYRSDLFVFGMVTNDLLFNLSDRYDEKMYNDLISGCSGEPIYDKYPDSNKLNTLEDQRKEYGDLMDRSYEKQTKNYCALQKVASLLPKEGILFFDFDKQKYIGWESLQAYESVIAQHNLPILSLDNLSHPLPEHYSPVWNVSPLDGHPSAYSNQLFAESLFKEITENPRWHFNYFSPSDSPGCQ
jgi:lysophospholipase L1-like esterase